MIETCSNPRLALILWFSIVLISVTLVLGIGTSEEAEAAEGTDKPNQILIRNASLLLTMDPAFGHGSLGVVKNGDVLIAGNRIKAVGTGLESSGSIMDATGKIVMPGFVDLHNHLWQSLIRGCGTDQELPGWLEKCAFIFGKLKLSASDIKAAVRLSTIDLINSGVTTVVDWSPAWTSEFVQGNLEALQDSGLRFAFAYVGSADAEEIDRIKILKRTLIDVHPRGTLQLGAHPGLGQRWLLGLSAMAKLARELDVTLHVHLLESQEQRAEDPIKALQQANALGPFLLVAHAIHLTDEEIEILAKNRVRVAHNPLSNMRLASGIIRLPELRAAGIPIGLGLDGGTNDTSDMFNTMRVAVGLQRVRSLRAEVYPSVSDVLRLATIEGATTLGMDGDIGSLTPGKKADVLILNPHTINFAPGWDWVSQIVFNGQSANVESVMIDGRPLKVSGKIINANQEEIVRAAEFVAEKIAKQVNLLE